MAEDRVLLALVVTSAADSGNNTLRDAINQVNQGVDSVINFAIGTGARTINLTSPLPPLFAGVTIDGTSQPGFAGSPLITIAGGGLSGDGLTIRPTSSTCTIQGLIIQGFGGSGIQVESANHVIGGTGPGQGNVLVQNGFSGVTVEGPQATGNVLLGNFIGTNASGANLGNGDFGVAFLAGASNNTVGGNTSAAANVIQFNATHGIFVEDPGTGNVFLGNTIVANGQPDIEFGPGANNPDAPQLVSLDRDEFSQFVTFELQGTPGTTATVEFFSDGPSATPPTLMRPFLARGAFFLSSSINTFQFRLPTDVPSVIATSTIFVGVGTSRFSNAVTEGPFDPLVVTTTADSGRGSLRQVLANAVNSPGATVRFNIGPSFGQTLSQYLDAADCFGVVIQLVTPVVVGSRVVLDGYSQVAYSNALAGNTPRYGPGPLVVIDGSGIITPQPAVLDASLVVQPSGSGSTIQGLAFNRQTNPANVPRVRAGVLVSGANDVRFLGDYVGTDIHQNNRPPLPNCPPSQRVGYAIGVWMVDAPQNVLGGAHFLDRNLISGNDGDGVRIEGAASIGNRIVNVSIGTDLAGATTGPLLVNLDHGVRIVGASQNTIAGVFSSTPNVITGNLNAGLLIEGGAQRNEVHTTRLGTNLAGDRALLYQGAGGLIGQAAGVIITGRNTAENSIGSAASATVGPTLISGNLLDGIRILDEARLNRVVNTFLGTDLTGANVLPLVPAGGPSTPVGNGGVGLVIVNAQENTIGGTNPTLPNLISGNRAGGVLMADGARANHLGNSIVGLDLTGSTALGGTLANPLQQDGVTVRDGQNNVVGGPTSDLAVVIAGNAGNGLVVRGGLATDNQVEYVLVGTTANGPSGASLGNLGDGVLVQDALNTRIGCLTPSFSGAVVLISGNQGNGLRITGTSSGTQVVRSFIGTNLAGNATSGALRNALNGVLIDGQAVSNYIGACFIGTTSQLEAPLPRNVIAGNGLAGVALQSARGNFVLANLIGTSTPDSAGRVIDLGNRGDGISVVNSPGNFLGLGPASLVLAAGTDPANRITGNLGRGVSISGPNSLGNQVRGNIIGTELGTGARFATGVDPALSPTQGNLLGGVRLDQAGGAILGGATAAEVNAIAGNRGDGVVLAQSATPNFVVGNVISRNSGHGVHATGPSSSATLPDEVCGNSIGTDLEGATTRDAASQLTLGNGLDGVFLDGVPVTVVANVISGNGNHGVRAARTVARQDLTGARIFGNRIGVNKAGDRAHAPLPGGGAVPLGNALDGVLLDDVFGVQVGPDTPPGQPIDATQIDPALANVISGNLGDGIEVRGPATPVATPTAPPNRVQLNLIGTDVTGTIARHAGQGLGNAGNGVFLVNHHATQVQGNVVSSNQAAGVRAEVDAQGLLVNANPLTIGGNHVGTNLSGTSIVDAGDGQTTLGNGENGITLVNVGLITPLDPSTQARALPFVIEGNLVSGNQANGVALVHANSVRVASNRVGTDVTGTRALPNQAQGLLLESAWNNLVGGANANASSGNLISGNAQAGVLLFTPNGTMGGRTTPSATSTNLLMGNRVGTDVTGLRALPNGLDGVVLRNAQSNTIGGADPDRNVISGNGRNGVLVFADDGAMAWDNLIAGNLIGLGQDGRTPLGNQANGVLLADGAVANIIGAAAGSVLPNTNVAATPSNVISANREAGVQLAGTSALSLVLGNHIGVTAQGARGDGLGNSVAVWINAQGSTPARHTIGGAQIGGGNVLVSATRSNLEGLRPASIVISGDQGHNVVQGNLVGLDANDAPALSALGILIDNSAHNLIGGTSPSARNIVAGYQEVGIQISGTAASSNMVLGNYVGTNRTGTNSPTGAAQEVGVYLLDAYGNTIGQGTYRDNAWAGNLISGNVTGVQFRTSSEIAGARNTRPGDRVAARETTVSGNVLAGNRIGTSANGRGVVPNTEFGVFLDNSAGNQVVANLISGNTKIGLDIVGPGSTRNEVLANLIGPTIDNQPLRTNGVLAQQHGVVIIGASNNAIGQAGRGNTIAWNREVGVYISRLDNQGVVYPEPRGNLVRSNAIRNNGVYGVLLYDAPNNTVPTTGPNRNVFSGASQISVFDYRTGASATTQGRRTAAVTPTARRVQPRLPTLFAVGKTPQRGATLKGR